jgi:glutamate-1-semialdehyde aminotransferase
VLPGNEYFVIQPDLATWGYRPPAGGVPVGAEFAYRSDTNDQWYSRDQIAAILAEKDF